MTAIRRTPDSRQAIFTVCTYSYLPKALVLLDSLRGAADLFVVLPETARPDRDALETAIGAQLLFLSDLPVPDPVRMAFQYDAFELSNAMKPFGFEALFAAGYEQVLYFDTDMEVYSPLSALWESLANADAVITPHIEAPLPDDGHTPNTEDVLRSGQFNGGFLALKETLATRAFLGWWGDRLAMHSLVHQNHYYFVDQFYLAMIASFIPNLRILRHPGANLAYWNLAEREPVSATAQGLTVSGQPLIFFHFSGFYPEDLPRLSRHQNRFRLPAGHPLLPLLAQYRDKLEAAETRLSAFDLDYSFAAYADGRPISLEDRRKLLLAAPAARQSLADPFQGLGALADSTPIPPWPVLRADFDAEKARAAEIEKNLRAELAATIADRDALRHALAEATAAYQSILGSTAWKLTAPLRALLEKARKS